MQLLLKKVVLGFLILSLIYSCNVSRLVHNAHKARVEDLSSIDKWLIKNKIPSAHICSILPEKFYSYVSVFEIIKGFPFIFKRDGVFVSYGYSNGAVCYKNFPEILSTLMPVDSISFFPSDYIVYPRGIKSDPVYDTIHFHLDTLKIGLVDLSGTQPIGLQTDSTFDYTVLIPFALYNGNTIQTHDLRKNIKAIQQNKRAKIKIILVNFDKQKWWGEEWLKKINISV